MQTERNSIIDNPHNTKHTMKATFLSSKTTSLILTITGFALPLQAIPTQISGAISFSGSTTVDNTSFVTATRFLSFQDVFVGSPSALSGDYVGTSGAAVTVTPFIWSPPTASTPIDPLWTFTSGGNTYSFDLSVLHVDLASPTDLLLSGLGTAHITGPGVDKLDTAGQWNFSAQTLGLANFTFSSTTTIPTHGVPDGGSTVAMLGTAFLGLSFLSRKQFLSKRS
jgi:hypothetical protein